jgi:hypothetical protein
MINIHRKVNCMYMYVLCAVYVAGMPVQNVCEDAELGFCSSRDSVRSKFT